MELYYLVGGLVGIATPGSESPPVRDLAATVAAISIMALAFGLALALLAGWGGHWRWPWLLVGFASGLALGMIGLFFVAVAFPIWLLSRPPVRELTPEESEGVECIAGSIGQSWYLRGRGYWIYRSALVGGCCFGLLVGLALWLGVFQGVFRPPARGLLASLGPPPPPDPLIPLKLVLVAALFMIVNGVGAWQAWKRQERKIRQAKGAPLSESLDGFGPYDRWMMRRGGRRKWVEALLIVLSPVLVGYFAMVLSLNCRRQLPLEQVWRERSEDRMTELRAVRAEEASAAAWRHAHPRSRAARSHGRPS